MSIYLHFTSGNMETKTNKQTYTIARYQYNGKYMGV